MLLEKDLEYKVLNFSTKKSIYGNKLYVKISSE